MSDASKAVFLSYAREDTDAARRIADALRAAGIEVWFDQAELRGGDAWDGKIREQIETCALFIPIISAHTEARREGYFRLEWNLADERTHLMAHGTPFIVPVVVDNTRERGALVPKSFLAVQWTRLPGGETPAAFVLRVQTLLGAKAPVTGSTAGAGAAAMATPTRNRGFPVWAIVALVAAVGGVAAYFGLRSPAKETVTPVAAAKPVAEMKAPEAPQISAKSIAVLPFANLSDDKDGNAFFAEGVHEDLLTNLALLRDLRVISRTTTVQYRDTKKTLRQIGDELGVAYIVEGSVRRVGKTVRVTAQLIRAANDHHLWAKNYDRELTDIFTIQSELSQAIAAELQAVISPEERSLLQRRPTENLAAYDLYLKARQVRHSARRVAWRREAKELLDHALRLDANFAAAWAELASIESLIYQLGSNDRESQRPEPLERAKVACETALRLDPNSPDVCRGVGEYFYRGHADFARAIDHFEKAIRLRPNDSDAFALIAAVRRRQGRWADSLRSFRQALHLDPGNLVNGRDLFSVYVAGRRFDEAHRMVPKLISLVGDDLRARFRLAYLPFLSAGQSAEVETFFASLSSEQAASVDALDMRKFWAARKGDVAEVMRIDRLQPGGLMEAAIALAVQGDRDALHARVIASVERMKSSLENNPRDEATVLARLAEVEALLGQKEDALRHARRAVELMPMSKDAVVAPLHLATLAFVEAWTGNKEVAISLYQQLLRTPSALGFTSWPPTVHEMKRDARYHPLRGDPRFEALLNDPKNNAPLF